MRHVTDEGLNLIKRFEGFSPATYFCPAGYPTIGYGHVVMPGERERYANGISQVEATDLLECDVQVAERAVLRLTTVPLTDSQFGALVSFTFNLGAGTLERSTLRRMVNRGENGDIPSELAKWVWAGGRRLPGLLRRRQAEGRLYGDLTQ
jgi:GH24 family phage-related lysozyme (muramidase)